MFGNHTASLSHQGRLMGEEEEERLMGSKYIQFIQPVIQKNWITGLYSNSFVEVQLKMLVLLKLIHETAKNMNKYLMLFLLLLISSELALVSAQLSEAELDRWDALTPFTSSKGFACVSPCFRKEVEPDYWCYVREGNSGVESQHGNLDNCSPNPGEDIQGTPCRTECTQGHASSSRYMCQTIHGYHNFCGRTIDSYNTDVLGQVKTVRGDYCVSQCERRENSSSYLCYAAGDRSFENCSPGPGLDIRGKKCANRCSTYGRNYTWCTLDNGEWNYCSSISVASETEFTMIGSKCVSPCQMTDSGSNKCWDGSEQLRECSRVNGLNTENRICGSFPCATTDGAVEVSHYWCRRYDEEEWDYCSLRKDDPRDSEEGLIVKNLRQWKQKDYFRKERIELGLTKAGNTRDNIFYLRDEQGPNVVTFYEAVGPNANNGTRRSDPMWHEPDVQNGVLFCLDFWKKLKYPIGRAGTRQNQARQLLVASTRYGVKLEREGIDSRAGVDYVTIQMLTSRDRNVLGTVESPVEVLTEDGEEIVGTMLKSVYGGFPVFIGRFRY